MTNKTKEFKMDESLEALVNVVGNTTALERSSRLGVNNDLRRNSEVVFSQVNQLGIFNIDPRTARHLVELDLVDSIRGVESSAYTKLNTKVDDQTYSEAKGFYLGKLDPEVKASFYVEMLRRGMMPDAPNDKAKKEEKDAYGDLVELKQEVDVMDALSLALEKNDMDRAKAIASKHMGTEDLELLSMYGYYGAPAFRNAERGIYEDVVNTRMSLAIEKLKDGKLYSLVDAGIAKHEQGKAHALVGMYGAYGNQKRVDEQKAEAAKKDAEAKKKAA